MNTEKQNTSPIHYWILWGVVLILLVVNVAGVLLLLGIKDKNQTVDVSVDYTFDVPIKTMVPVKTVVDVPVTIPIIGQVVTLKVPIDTEVPINVTVHVPIKQIIPVKVNLK